MKTLTEAEIAKAYVGKPYNVDHLRKIAMGTQTGVVVFSRRITQSQGALVGITDEIFNKWWDADVYVKISIELDEESQLIKECTFEKYTAKDIENEKYQFSSLTPNDEDLRIFLNVMEYVTTEVKKETKIILIRHGESLGNAALLYLGHTDLDLSPKGYEQARIAAESIKDMEISAVYSSSLIRAHNTALPHAKLRGLEVIDSDDLREIYIGDWEGMSVDELKNKKEFIEGWVENFGTFTTPNGESVPHAAERMYSAVLEIAKKHIGETVLIAAHAAVIRSFYGKVSGIPAEKLAAALPFPTNTSLTTVVYDGEVLLPVSYSDDSHLKN